MKQFTVKRTVEALYWLHNNPHHIVGSEWGEPFNADEGPKAIYYQNYHEKMRVTKPLMQEVLKHIKANTRKFDTRMYMLTPAGKRMIGQL